MSFACLDDDDQTAVTPGHMTSNARFYSQMDAAFLQIILFWILIY